MLVRCLTKSAGRLCFEPGQEIDLAQADAEALLAAGAVVSLEVVAEVQPDEPKTDGGADKPANRAKRRT